MITIDNKTHDKILKQIEALELRVADLTDRNYNRRLPKLATAIARLEGAQEVFDIINGNK